MKKPKKKIAGSIKSESAPPVKLSVCMIAKNEQHNLPRALKSVAGIADEIIVVDSGSTDDTPAIAKQFGAHLEQFVWCDDFAAARNCSLDHARGEWVLRMDADEELLPSSKEELINTLEMKDVLGCTIMSQDLVSADRPDHFTTMQQLRLFRRHPDLRFRGRIHEHFHPPIMEIAKREGMRVIPSSITFRHYGYVGELRREKLDRSVKLLEMELRDRPGQLYFMIEFGRTLLMLNDPRAPKVLDEAVEMVIPHLDDPAAPIPLVALLFEYLLMLPEDRLPFGLNRIQLYKLIQRWFPASPPLLWLIAKQVFAQGRLDQAEIILRSLVKMGEGHQYDPSVSFNPSIIGDEARINLGNCLMRQGKLNEAEQYYSSLLSSKTFSLQARAGLKALEDITRRGS